VVSAVPVKPPIWVAGKLTEVCPNWLYVGFQVNRACPIRRWSPGTEARSG